MRPWQVPLAVHWDLEPGRVEILLRQEVGNHLPWLELALALVVLLALADGRLLLPGAAVAAGAIALGYVYETHALKRRPALIRLNWEAQEAELTYNDGRTVRTALKEPCYAHPVKLLSHGHAPGLRHGLGEAGRGPHPGVAQEPIGVEQLLAGFGPRRLAGAARRNRVALAGGRRGPIHNAAARR